MKFTTAIVTLLASLSAFCGIRTITLGNGSTTVSGMDAPYGPVKLVGYETMMASSNDNGTSSIRLDRLLKMDIDKMSVTTVVTTQKVVSVLSVANDYTIDAAYYPSEGAEPNEFEVAFSNCYSSTTKGVSLGSVGTMRTTFKPGSGTATQTEPTNYFVKCEIDGAFNWYTNFVWESGQSSIVLRGLSGTDKVVTMEVTRLVPPKYIMQTNNVIHTTYTTNRWKEVVSRYIPVQVAPSIATTNGYSCVSANDNVLVYQGDSIYCSSPISTNAPGRIRAIICD